MPDVEFPELPPGRQQLVDYLVDNIRSLRVTGTFCARCNAEGAPRQGNHLAAPNGWVMSSLKIGTVEVMLKALQTSGLNGLVDRLRFMQHPVKPELVVVAMFCKTCHAIEAQQQAAASASGDHQ